MGGACGTYRGEDRHTQNYGGETTEIETTWKDLGVDGSVIQAIFNKQNRVRNGLIWLRTGTSCRQL